MKPVVKGVLVGCGGLMILSFLGVVAFFVWIGSLPESGVKLGNEMDKYAVRYLEENRLVGPDEEVLAYYDATISMNGTEAAILTDRRVMYHKDGQTSEIPIEQIEDVRHRYEGFTGDIIEVQSSTGQTMKIEIAPMNSGETFRNVLTSVWERTHGTAAEG